MQKKKRNSRKQTNNPNTQNFSRTGSLASRTSDELKAKGRVFGSLLRRHTSFGAPDSRGSTLSTPPTISAPIMQDTNQTN